jgi:hypothetical protein
MGGKGKGRGGFYGGFRWSEDRDSGVDAEPERGLRRMLAEAIRKNPGELHLLLQGSKLLLRGPQSNDARKLRKTKVSVYELLAYLEEQFAVRNGLTTDAEGERLPNPWGEE